MEVINASTRNLQNVLHECSAKIDQKLKEGLSSKRWVIEDKHKWIIGPESVNIYWRWEIFRGKKDICYIYCEYDSSLETPLFFQLTEGEGSTLLTNEFKDSVRIQSQFVKVYNEEEGADYISVELPITPDLSEKQIEDCACEFINKVLRPYLDLLTSTFCN